MSFDSLRWPASAVSSLLAALTTWVALWGWAGFVERASGYLLPAAAVCLIVAGSGMLLRSTRAPSILVVLSQMTLLLVWLNWTWAAEQMYGGWIPSPDSMSRVGQRIASGVQVSQAYSAPVPESAPQIYALLVIAGAGAAVLIDFLACGLRRVPLAGLPLLAVYTAPLGILDDGVSWWAFAACALSFLFLLSSDEARRLSSWGRHLSGGGEMFDALSIPVSTASVRESARKIGLTATGLAVIVPIFVPTLTSNLFGGGGPGGGSDGGAVSISNPIVDLKRDLTRGEDVELIQVGTREPDPSYLRISVLDYFDGDTWKPSGRDIPVVQRARGRLPRPPGLDPGVPRAEVSYALETSTDFESRWLPTPYPASAVDVDGDWRYDRSTLDIISAADGQTAASLRYSLKALRIEPEPQGLAAAAPVSQELFSTYTALPDSMPDLVRDLARSVTEDQASRFEQAVRLQEWFRDDGGFTYSLDREAGNGIDELEQFLGNGPRGRIGYCEQFAAAMSLMGRSIGIPSRVAVGFLRPDRVRKNVYVYSAHDLHAWPEMYFEGTGWIRFEPTPPDRAGSVPGYTVRNVPAEAPSEQPSPLGPGQQQNRFGQQDLPESPQASAGGSSGGGLRGALIGVVGAAGLLLLAAAPRLARAAVRRRRWTRAGTPVELAEAAWSELRDTAIDLRLPWDDAVTLRSRARSLVQSFGEPSAEVDHRVSLSGASDADANQRATAALERLVKFVERARFARSVAAPKEDVVEDVGLCAQALRDGVSEGRRAYATWLPRSLANTFGAGLDRRRLPRAEGPILSGPGVDRAI